MTSTHNQEQAQDLRVQVRQHDTRLRLVARRGDANTAATTAQVENASRRRARPPRPERVADHFRQRRARHQRPVIAAEFEAGEPGRTEQVGQRLAGEPARQQCLHAVSSSGRHSPPEHLFAALRRQAENTEHQRHGLVPGVVSAVPEIHAAALQLRVAALEKRGDRAGCQRCIVAMIARCYHRHSFTSDAAG